MSPVLRILRDILRSPSGRAGVALLAIVVVAVVVSYLWIPYDPLRPVPGDDFLGISRDHLFGTDASGRDLFSGVIAGARVSLLVGVTSALVAGAIGTLLGVLSAITPRAVGESVAYVIDVLIALPTIVLALVLLGLFGGSLFTVSLAIGFGSGTLLARVLRAETKRVLSHDYITAAAASGTSTLRTVFRHILPNIAPVAIVQLSLIAGLAIIAEASLSLLGLTSLSRPSWGRMLRELQATLSANPGPIAYPGGALVIAVLGFNLLGDGLRDALDPRLRTNRGALLSERPDLVVVPADDPIAADREAPR